MTNFYKEAGVDIDQGNQFVEDIKPLVKKTFIPGVLSLLGGFGAIFDPKETGLIDPIFVSGTDGVGSKLQLAQKYNIHHTIGIDLVAMCANDVLCHGAKPLYFLDYLAVGKLDVKRTKKIIHGMVDGCLEAGCALVGGETAEMSKMYDPESYEMAGFCVGAVERHNLLPKNVKQGDIILGLESSGVHSNGFSMIVDDPQKYLELLTPTKIYVKTCLPLVERLNAMVHITGGGLVDNVPRVIPDGLCADIEINWPLPDIFSWIMDTTQADQDEMLRVFNCGIGMVLIVNPDNLSTVCEKLTEYHTIGKIVKSKTEEKITIRGNFR